MAQPCTFCLIIFLRARCCLAFGRLSATTKFIAAGAIIVLMVKLLLGRGLPYPFQNGGHERLWIKGAEGILNPSQGLHRPFTSHNFTSASRRESAKVGRTIWVTAAGCIRGISWDPSITVQEKYLPGFPCGPPLYCSQDHSFIHISKSGSSPQFGIHPSLQHQSFITLGQVSVPSLIV